MNFTHARLTGSQILYATLRRTLQPPRPLRYFHGGYLGRTCPCSLRPSCRCHFSCSHTPIRRNRHTRHFHLAHYRRFRYRRPCDLERLHAGSTVAYEVGCGKKDYCGKCRKLVDECWVWREGSGCGISWGCDGWWSYICGEEFLGGRAKRI